MTAKTSTVEPGSSLTETLCTSRGLYLNIINPDRCGLERDLGVLRKATE